MKPIATLHIATVEQHNDSLCKPRKNHIAHTNLTLPVLLLVHWITCTQDAASLNWRCPPPLLPLNHCQQPAPPLRTQSPPALSSPQCSHNLPRLATPNAVHIATQQHRCKLCTQMVGGAVAGAVCSYQPSISLFWCCRVAADTPVLAVWICAERAAVGDALEKSWATGQS